VLPDARDVERDVRPLTGRTTSAAMPHAPDAAAGDQAESTHASDQLPAALSDTRGVERHSRPPPASSDATAPAAPASDTSTQRQHASDLQPSASLLHVERLRVALPLLPSGEVSPIFPAGGMLEPPKPRSLSAPRSNNDSPRSRHSSSNATPSFRRTGASAVGPTALHGKQQFLPVTSTPNSPSRRPTTRSPVPKPTSPAVGRPHPSPRLDGTAPSPAQRRPPAAVSSLAAPKCSSAPEMRLPAPLIDDTRDVQNRVGLASFLGGQMGSDGLGGKVADSLRARDSLGGEDADRRREGIYNFFQVPRRG